MRLSFLLLLHFALAHALPFSLIKHEASISNGPTLFVIGGIHGNEPGSYFAAAVLAQNYQIEKGNLWIVPNLNHKSILMNSRGIHGDMNRKFSDIPENDPDFDTVTEIKKLITDPQVDLILNLHDGHGFYRKEYKNTIFNPGAWGQTCVIDQETLDGDHPYKNLDQIALNISKELNNGLIEGHHYFDVRNTNTRFDDEAMRHSLTFFAINHNKPAFAIETSKNLSTLHEKVFYQLRAIECYMRYMGISFKRNFDLTPLSVKNILTQYGVVTINNNLYLDLYNIKNYLSFIPLESGENQFSFSHVLGGVRQNGKSYDLYIGNQKVSSLSSTPQFNDKCETTSHLEIDGVTHNISFAKEYLVNTDLKVLKGNSATRVNIIGFTQKGKNDESGIQIGLKDMDAKYSIDKDGKKYRAEFYRENSFCGMVLIHFK